MASLRGGPRPPPHALGSVLLRRVLLGLSARPALVAVLLHLAREVVGHEVHGVADVVRALARSERHPLEPQRALRHLRIALPRLLPELDGQLSQRRDLPRNLPQLLLNTREKLVVRACAASTLHLDAHLPSWDVGYPMIGLPLPAFQPL